MKGLAEARKKANIRQTELAEKMQVNQSTISMWESGAASPKADRLPKLASILGCTIDALFGSTDGEEADKA